MLQLLAVAALLCLSIIVVPLMLVAVWWLQASSDPPVMGRVAVVTARAVALLR